MKKLLAAALVLFMVSAAAGTSIRSETLTVDLESSEATAVVEVADLTSPRFTYITSADVQSVDASTGSKTLECEIQDIALGDEIRCDNDLRKNFTVRLHYTFDDLVSNGGTKTFRYTHPIYRPTEQFTFRVKLPRGTGLAGNSSAAVSPDDGRIGSDGQQIFVRWERNPSIGDTLSFQVRYEQLNRDTSYTEIIIAGLILLLVGSSAYLYWRWSNRENLDSVYGDITDDEKEVLDLLRENDGEMLQKDVVDSSDYSKAKISGVVSSLVDKDILEKEKEGRSNKLKIATRYRY